MMKPVEVLTQYKPTVSVEVFAECIRRVILAYAQQQQFVPEHHIWRVEKVGHVQATATKVRAWCDHMHFSEEVSLLIELTSLAHDLGRFPQIVLQMHGEAIDPIDHGRLSVVLLGELKPFLGADWPMFAEAVAMHSMRKTPSRSEFSSAEAWAVCCVIRDFDKTQGFDEARNYTHIREKMIGHAQANKLPSSEENPSAETGSIDTLPGYPDVLDEFLKGATITRTHCASYEAFMLQYLAWLYDFNVPEVRDVVIKDGGPGMVLSYLRTQLGVESAQYSAIAAQAEKAWSLKI